MCRARAVLGTAEPQAPARRGERVAKARDLRPEFYCRPGGRDLLGGGTTMLPCDHVGGHGFLTLHAVRAPQCVVCARETANFFFVPVPSSMLGDV